MTSPTLDLSPTQARDAVRRVLALADAIERGEAGAVGQGGAARLIRVAVADSAAALTREDDGGDSGTPA